MGVRGGSHFTRWRDFGRHHILQEDHFFELAGVFTVEVEFIVTIRKPIVCSICFRGENVRVFYAVSPLNSVSCKRDA